MPLLINLFLAASLLPIAAGSSKCGRALVSSPEFSREAFHFYPWPTLAEEIPGDGY